MPKPTKILLTELRSHVHAADVSCVALALRPEASPFPHN
jgi:hypothetical protein